MGSKRRIIRVLLFDPDATDSDSDSETRNSQIKNKKTVIQTIELRKSAPIRKPKTLIQTPKPPIPTTNPPKSPKILTRTTNVPKSVSPENPKKTKNSSKALKEDSNSVRKQPSSQYKGVRRRQSGNWAAEIRDPIRGTRIWLGTFKSEQLAHQVYQAAFMHFEQEKTKWKESKSKQMKETQTTGPVQCFQPGKDFASFMKKKRNEGEINTGDVQCFRSVLASQSPLIKKKGDDTGHLEMTDDEINTENVQCFQPVKPQPASHLMKKKRTETLIRPAVQPPPAVTKIGIFKKDLTCETGTEKQVKSGSSITSVSAVKSSFSTLDFGLSEKEKGETEELFPGLEIPEFDFRFDGADDMLLLGDFGGEEDLIRLDDVPLWTENLDSCDLSFLDL